MPTRLSLVVSVLALSLGCSKAPIEQPSGPIARYGTKPVIDGEFEAGEWDDATAVRVGESHELRIKHDSANLYLAISAGGGNIWFDKQEGMQVLHWSAQLGSASYRKFDSTTQVMDRAFDFSLWGLEKEPLPVARETLSRYLADNGWAANISPMGPKMQSEFAISFNWLGVKVGAERYQEVPGFHISAGLLLTPDDPETAQIMALPKEERRKRYPLFFWPEGLAADHILNAGECPDTVRIDGAGFGKIWVDFQI